MTARVLTLGSWALCVLATLASLVLLGMGVGHKTPGDTFVLGGAGGLAFAFSGLAFGTVGALVARRMPSNKVGWVFCGIGLALSSGNAVYQYADQVLYGSASGLPGATAAAVLQNALVPPVFGLLAVALMIFPDGRLPSRRWWPGVAAALVGGAFTLLGYTFRPGVLDSPFTSVTNPFGIPGTFSLRNNVSAFGWPIMAVGSLIAAGAMRSRLKKAGGLERLQLKWVAFAASVAGVLLAVNVVTFFWVGNGGALNLVRIGALGIAFSVIPVAAGVAILRYRLYDIDVVINRTLVYATLTATLAGVYVGSILLLQLALEGLTEGSGLAVAASTLATAALVRPARARIQQLVDRRFFRRKYDAARTLEHFGAHVRSQVDLHAVTAELRAVVAETMQPAHVTLWIPGELSMTNSRNDLRTQNR
ncbi:MAG: hypothetical protein ACJ72E_09120 [Marmoricola sp.]